MIENTAFAEAYALVAGLFMAGVAGLLWRHHAMRPAWGLNWVAAGLAMGAGVNLLPQFFITANLSADTVSARRLLTMMLGWGSLVAMLVGVRHYVLRPLLRPWRFFLMWWLAAQVSVLILAVNFGWKSVGDVVAAGMFSYGAILTLQASRREPQVGHQFLALTFLLQPLTVIFLAVASLDPRTTRYLASVPHAMVGLVLLSTILVRLRRELLSELQARGRAEAELALSRTQLMANLENSPSVAVQWFDREGRVLYWNPASEVLYGVPSAEVVGTVPLGVLFANEAELQVLLKVIHHIQLSGRAYPPYEVEITRRDGRKVWVLASIFPIPFKDGQTAFVCMEVDITERKEAERRLAELNQTLEARIEERTRELGRAQQDLMQAEKLAALGGLVAGVAHELNTPIGNAVTVASTLTDMESKLRSKLDKGLTRSALSEFLDAVRSSGDILNRNLTRAADLVISFKQVAVDQSNHQRRAFDVQELLSEVQIIMAPSLRKAHVALAVDVPEELTMNSFPGALTQALMILISNAITHAFDGRDGGMVTIKAESLGADQLSISVRDNGVGIPAENLGRVFEPFFTTKLGQGGSGLGLHICYNLVTGTLGGKVSAQSSPGEGTCVRIDIPLTAPATSSSNPS